MSTTFPLNVRGFAAVDEHYQTARRSVPGRSKTGVDIIDELKSFRPSVAGTAGASKEFGDGSVAGLVRVQREDVVLTIVIDREERRNALNEAVARQISAGLDAEEADRSVRAVVLTGAGDKAFCAGGDLQPAADGAPFTIDAATRAITSPSCCGAWIPADFLLSLASTVMLWPAVSASCAPAISSSPEKMLCLGCPR